MKAVENATAGDGSTIRIGSVVKLKTGGARMVVNAMWETQADQNPASMVTAAACVWHTGGKHGRRPAPRSTTSGYWSRNSRAVALQSVTCQNDPMNDAYLNYRERNNAAARKSKAAAKEARARPEWVKFHPDLSRAEKRTVKRFLNGGSPALTAKARDLIYKHLVAARGIAREHYARELERLDSLPGSDESHTAEA